MAEISRKMIFSRAKITRKSNFQELKFPENQILRSQNDQKIKFQNEIFR